MKILMTMVMTMHCALPSKHSNSEQERRERVRFYFDRLFCLNRAQNKHRLGNDQLPTIFHGNESSLHLSALYADWNQSVVYAHFEHLQIDVYSKHSSRTVYIWCMFCQRFCHFPLSLPCHWKWIPFWIHIFSLRNRRYMKGSHLHQCYVNPIRFVGTTAIPRVSETESTKKNWYKRSTKVTHFYWHKNPVLFIEDELFTNDPAVS